MTGETDGLAKETLEKLHFFEKSGLGFHEEDVDEDKTRGPTLDFHGFFAHHSSGTP